jgi:chemotaxis protein CheX
MLAQTKMDERFFRSFINATQTVLKTMSQTEPIAGQVAERASGPTFGSITGVIGMSAEKISGNLIISFDEQSILAIVSRMFMDQFTNINQEVVDAVGEITNIICGAAKRELADQGILFDMATPMVISGEHIELKQLSKNPITSVTFSTPEGKFVVETNFGPRGPGK